MTEKLEVLKRCSFVRELDGVELKILAEMAHEEVFEVGESLARQGRTQEYLYVIQDGLVGIYLELGPMNQRLLQSASSCDVVGWSAMLPPYRATSVAKAMETTKVLTFNGRDLVNLCETHPKMGCRIHRGMASVIAERLRYAFDQLMGVTIQESG